MLNHADYTAPTRQHEVDHTDHTDHTDHLSEVCILMSECECLIHPRQEMETRFWPFRDG